MNLKLTPTGKSLLLRSLSDSVNINFVNVQLGKGSNAGDQATALSTPVLTVGISDIDIDGAFVTLSTMYNNNEIATGFRATETGVFVDDPDVDNHTLLFAYGYVASAQAEYIPSSGETVVETILNVLVYIGDAENVTASISQESIYVPKNEFDSFKARTDNPHQVTKEQVGLGNVQNVSTNDQTPTYTDSSTMTALTSGEKISVAFGKIAKAVSSLITHLADTTKHITEAERTSWNGKANSAHSHTAAQITSGTISIARGGTGASTATAAKANLGLGNVPNVSTNDQTPTYTEASVNTALVSGETLSSAFGKIAKAVSSLITHLADTTKHITEAERTSWNGKAAGSHTHEATDIASGTIPVERGGTGQTSFDDTPTENSVKPVKSGGVFTALSGKANTSHSHNASDIKSGTLPVARGGTGVSTAAEIGALAANNAPRAEETLLNPQQSAVCRYIRQPNGIVTLILTCAAIAGSASETTVNLFTLPQQLRPTNTVYAAADVTTGNYRPYGADSAVHRSAFLVIHANGVVNVAFEPLSGWDPSQDGLRVYSNVTYLAAEEVAE